MSEHSEPANHNTPPSVDRFSTLWRRVNEHKLVQWTVAYVALAYGIQHGVTLTAEAFEWPHAVERVSMLLLILGLPVVMTLAWYQGARASRQFSHAELSILSALLVIGAFLFYTFARPSTEIAAGATSTANPQAVAVTGTLASEGISVAVLPFANLSTDKEQEFFSDGMTDEIASALAKVPALRMVGRTSAFQFKGQNRDLRTIGRSLGATYIIEGSVRKAGDRVRVTAQLVKADDGIGLWTDNYDRELKDIFATQEDIAQAIAGALRVPLGLSQGKTLVSNRTGDLDSYQQYLRAKTLIRGRLVNSSLAGATALLEDVVARDPGFAPAWALLAQAYELTPVYDPATQRRTDVDALRRSLDLLLPKAEAAAKRAIQLDPGLADGYGALGRVDAERGKLLVAEDLFKQALALDPNNPDVVHFYREVLVQVGRLKEALAMSQRLQALEPYVGIFNGVTGGVLWLNGKNDAALAILKQYPASGPLAAIYASMGRYREAADVLISIPPGNYPPGAAEEAARVLRTAPARIPSTESLPRLGLLGFVYLYVGAPERALEYYEGTADAGYVGGITNAVLWHPDYAPVRKTERFKAILRKIGTVEYWRARGWPEFCHPVSTDDFACE